MLTWYYPHTIRNIVTALSDMFNDLKVQRLDDYGVVSKEISVPITFGPVNKFQYYRKERETGKDYYMQLPRISIVPMGFNYSAERACGINETRQFYDNALGLDNITEFVTDIQPTPYDIDFDMMIRTESMDDFSQILENILPYFNPALYLRVKEFSFLDVERTLQVLLTGVSPEFITDQEESEKREVNAILSFTIAAWMYRPVKNAKVIKEIRSRYFVDTNGSSSSATNILTEQYNTSAFADTSAFSSSADYDTSGTFSALIDGQSATGYYAVNAQSFTYSAGELP